MAAPLVSVCFVSYNHAAYVEQALRSAIAQDYDPLEIVVGDDGSTDGTFERIEAIARECPGRVRVLPRRENTGLPGISANYNRVLEACRGEFIAFLEGDDYYLPGKIAAQVAWLEADAARVLCGHDVDAFDSDTGDALYRWSDRFGLRTGSGAGQIIKDGVPFSTVTVMVRTSAVPATGFDARLTVVLDWKFWIDCLGRDGAYGHVPSVLAKYRRHAGNVSSKYAAIGQLDQFLTLALVESQSPWAARACARGRARLHYTYGLYGLLSHEASARADASRRLREAFRSEPVRYWKAVPALVAAAAAPAWYRRRLLGAHGQASGGQGP